jgi:energy-coupling factor transport system permease protein
MFDKNVFIFKLDIRVKILFILIYTILVFYVDKLQINVVLLLSIITIRIAWKIPFRSIKPIISISLLVLLLHILFTSGENYILKPLFGFSLKLDGLFSGLTIVCRLAALMLILPILTETASVHKIAHGLIFFCVNYRAAFIITTAFNLIPIFREESRAIMDAQKLRGSIAPTGCASFEKGRTKVPRTKARNFFAKLKAYPALVVPLVLGAMRKAQSASLAMDSRAFGAFRKRTWLEKPVIKVHDYLFLAGFLIFSFFAVYANYFLL